MTIAVLRVWHVDHDPRAEGAYTIVLCDECAEKRDLPSLPHAITMSTLTNEGAGATNCEDCLVANWEDDQ